MAAGQPWDARDAVGEGEKITRLVVPPDTQVALSHLAGVQGEGVARKVTFQGDHSECTDYPPAPFSPALRTVAVETHKDYEGDSEDDAASYASDEGDKRDDAEQPVEVAAQTQRRVMQRLCFAISTEGTVNPIQPNARPTDKRPLTCCKSARTSSLTPYSSNSGLMAAMTSSMTAR